jgi:YesN/AraC family two-component response regulator
VVDDHLAVVQAVEAALAPALTVEAAGDGVTAIAAVSCRPPDVVLLDLKLPDMSGLRVLEAMRAVQVDLPVVVLTGHSSEAAALAAANLSVSGYLVKPFGLADLRRQISSALVVRLARRTLLEPQGRGALETAILRAELALLRSGPVPAACAARLASAVGISRRQLRSLRARGGSRLGRQALMERRITEAKALLRETREPIKAIAANLGFHDAAHFSRRFRAWVGQTPLDYRRRSQPPRPS